MSDKHDADHLYYRWRTYSFAQGYSERTWRVEPFQMSIGGPVYIPPPLPYFDREKTKKRQAKDSASDVSDDINESKNDYFKNSRNSVLSITLPSEIKTELEMLLNNLHSSEGDQTGAAPAYISQDKVCSCMIFIMENTNFCKPMIAYIKDKIIQAENVDHILR